MERKRAQEKVDKTVDVLSQASKELENEDILKSIINRKEYQQNQITPNAIDNRRDNETPEAYRN
jgi:hypothetical protein